MAPLVAADDLRHALTGPHARESLFHNLHLPDEGLSVFFYTWVDSQDRAGRLFSVIADNDERLAFDLADGLPAAGRDFDDWEAGGLTVRHAKALEVAELTWSGPGASLEMTFEALHPAFSYSANEDGVPPLLADDRFEQSGAVQGTLTVGSRRIGFETTAHRDHSWGARDWGSVHHWKWISAQAGPGCTLNALYLLGDGRAWTCGYVSRHGTVTPLREVKADATYDDRFFQQHVSARLVDADGRATTVEADRFSLLAFAPHEHVVMHEAGCAGTIDGEAALVHVEMGWAPSYVANQVATRGATPGWGPRTTGTA